MSRIVQFCGCLALVGVVAACGNRNDDVVVIEPEPISVEPVFTGKYK